MINVGIMSDNQTNPPIGSNAYASAASAYGVRQDANMSGFEVTAKLYDGMIKFVGQAKKSYADGQLDHMCTYIQKTNKILIALQSGLNFNEGGEAAVFLNDFYTEIFKRLFGVLRTDNPEKEFDDVHEMLKPAAKIWAAHAENAKKGTPDSHVAIPPTGE